MDALLLLGVDEVELPKAGTVIYIGTHGDAARIAPTSSCRAPPTPKRTRPGSTPKAACNTAAAPRSRRAKRRKTGPSCARSPALDGQDAAVRLASRRSRAKMIADHPTLRSGRLRAGRGRAPASIAAKIGADGQVSNEPFAEPGRPTSI